MSTWTYDASGQRVLFDSERTARDLPGCLLCHDPVVVVVGVCHPMTDETRAAVMKLRGRPAAPRSDAGLAYGLCHRCFTSPDVTDRVEIAILEMAERVTVQ